MNLYVGTSGYSYKEWRGSFYPEEMSEKQMLRYYSERFNSVEINNTFYRMPKPSTLEAWAAEVPENFRFILKGPQRITHMQRLKEVGDSVAYFLSVAVALKDQLGPLLFQLPPYLKCDVARLAAFLALVPKPHRVAVEFRHESWFVDEVFTVLRDAGAALCIAESDEGPEVPFESTADWGYLRLRRLDYGDAELGSWAKRIQEKRWGESFVFFKHEDAGIGPKLAKRFLELYASPTGT